MQVPRKRIRHGTYSIEVRAVFVASTLLGLVAGLMVAIPLADTAGACPEQAQNHSYCVVQKIWAKQFTIVVLLMCATPLLAHLLCFSLPRLVRCRAGARIAAARSAHAAAIAQPARSRAADLQLLAASWGGIRPAADHAGGLWVRVAAPGSNRIRAAAAPSPMAASAVTGVGRQPTGRQQVAETLA